MTLPAAIVPWASVTVNYAAGGSPWSAQPTKVSPGSDVFTPESAAAAEYHNYILNELGVYANALRTWFSAEDTARVADILLLQRQAHRVWIRNWNVDTTGATLITGACYDGTACRWSVMNSTDSTHAAVLHSYDGGLTWADSGGGDSASGTYLLGMYVAPATGAIYAFRNGAATLYKLSVTTWSTPAGTYPNFDDAAETLFDGTRWITAGHGTGTNLEIWSAPLATPEVWTIGGGGGLPADVTGAQRCVAAASSTVYVVMGRDLANSESYGTSADHGTTFTTRTLSGGVYASTSTITALTYDSVRALFVLCIRTNGGVSNVFTSPDGVTWTSAGASISSAFRISGIQAMGTLWIAVSTTLSGSREQIWYSSDAGVTWDWADQVLKSNAGTEGASAHPEYVRSQIVSDATAGRFLVYNGKGARTSLACG